MDPLARPASPSPVARLSPAQIDRLRHPSETSRLVLATVVGWIVGLVALLFTLATSGAFLLALLALVGLVWVGLQLLRARLVGHSIRADADTFPHIAGYVAEARARLGVDEEIDVFIIEEGAVQAYIARFFRTRYIILTSGMVGDLDDARTQREVQFIICRFVAALAAKHHRGTLTRIVVDAVSSLKVLNFFLMPYERATQYSGDQIALVAVGDLEASLHALNRMMVGGRLHDRLALRSVLAQAREVDGFFGMVARVLSPFPHMVHRVRNLLTFAQEELPEEYRRVVLGGDLARPRAVRPDPGTEPYREARPETGRRPGARGERAHVPPSQPRPVDSGRTPSPSPRGPSVAAAPGETSPPLATVPLSGAQVASIGLATWLVSWVLPAFSEPNARGLGFEAFLQATALLAQVVGSPMDILGGSGGTMEGTILVLAAVTPLTNFVVATAVVALFAIEPPEAEETMWPLLAGCAALNTVWIFYTDTPGFLRPGYWAWLFGTGLFALGLWVRARNAGRGGEGAAPAWARVLRDDRGFQTGLAAWAVLLLAAGFVIGY